MTQEEIKTGSKQIPPVNLDTLRVLTKNFDYFVEQGVSKIDWSKKPPTFTFYETEVSVDDLFEDGSTPNTGWVVSE